MANETTNETEGNKEETKETPAHEHGGAGDSGKPATSTGTEDDSIRKIIAEEVAKALGNRPASATVPAMASAASIEARAEEMVKAAAEKLVKEQEHAKEHETLKEVQGKAKEVAEQTPKKIRRLTKALWGDDD